LFVITLSYGSDDRIRTDGSGLEQYRRRFLPGQLSFQQYFYIEIIVTSLKSPDYFKLRSDLQQQPEAFLHFIRQQPFKSINSCRASSAQTIA
jgi:hypothetical protein